MKETRSTKANPKFLFNGGYVWCPDVAFFYLMQFKYLVGC